MLLCRRAERDKIIKKFKGMLHANMEKADQPTLSDER